jgi:hypothetical protein
VFRTSLVQATPPRLHALPEEELPNGKPLSVRNCY